jgi:hypothetical protein
MFIMMDVETDGPIVGHHSMFSFGAVLCRNSNERFYGLCKPLSKNDYIEEAFNISSLKREDVMEFPEPKKTMEEFRNWLHEMREKYGKPYEKLMFISDNNGFDWQWINWYFLAYCDYNPFGFSSTSLGSLYKGVVRNTFKNFKHLRKTKHTHNPVDDALGNVEALEYIIKKYNISINL